MGRYTPDRGDLIWLDFDPTLGKEIGKYRPALVLSSTEHNEKSGLLICCPISTSIRGQKTEVLISDSPLGKRSVVATNIVNTLSWGERKAQFIGKVEQSVLREVQLRVLTVIGAGPMIEAYIEEARNR